MTCINPSVITYQLNVDPKFKPIKQKRRKFKPNNNIVINEEIQKLLSIGYVREVQFPKYLANVEVIRKNNGKRRV